MKPEDFRQRFASRRRSLEKPISYVPWPGNFIARLGLSLHDETLTWDERGCDGRLTDFDSELDFRGYSRYTIMPADVISIKENGEKPFIINISCVMGRFVTVDDHTLVEQLEYIGLVLRSGQPWTGYDHLIDCIRVQQADVTIDRGAIFINMARFAIDFKDIKPLYDVGVA